MVITANDAVYQEWQSLIMYWWYQRVKRENPDCDMGGFTRVLHAWKPDGLMDKLPTMLVNPLPRGQDQGYVVLNRPFALMQFMEQVDTLFPVVRRLCRLVHRGVPASRSQNTSLPRRRKSRRTISSWRSQTISC